jgi:LPXTG-site transpeptidase (sortase) family protein
MKLRKVNDALLVAIISVNAFVIIVPFAPQLEFWWQSRSAPTLPVSSQIAESSAPDHRPTFPKDNRLLVASIHLDEPIIEGSNEHALMSGPWRRPLSSTPDKGGNTVIAGHRFTYNNPRGSFYFLDKVRVGDELDVVWQSKAYIYKVKTVNIVSPDDRTVEAPTATPRLTLYTCTPLWWPKDRLVVVADLEKTYE